jgi:SPP1 family predicted phage head-tail adaptor
MQSGSLRCSITIRRPVHTTGSTGELLKDTWADVVTTFAQVQPLEGREYYSAAKKVGEVLWRFVVRWRDDITADMRVIMQGMTFGIRSITEVDDKLLIVGVRVV